MSLSDIPKRLTWGQYLDLLGSLLRDPSSRTYAEAVGWQIPADSWWWQMLAIRLRLPKDAEMPWPPAKPKEEPPATPEEMARARAALEACSVFRDM